MTGLGPRVAVVQGRLLPPVDGRLQAFPTRRWREEFERAREAGVDAIEWIYDTGANPLDAEEGLGELVELAADSAVAVSSICADYFMRRPLASDGEALGKLLWLVRRAGAIGATHVVVPFVDESALATAAAEDAAAERLAAALPAAREAGVELHAETSLPPRRFAAFLERVPELRVTYDTGNSAALGFDPAEELAAYGERVGSVHVKDRLRGGGSVPLGEGDARLGDAFSRLRGLGYDGPLVLQVARGPAGEEVAWVRAAREAVERLWRETA